MLLLVKQPSVYKYKIKRFYVLFAIFEFFKSSEYNITNETASSIGCFKIVVNAEYISE